MRILFSLIFAGIAARLKPTVTALLQHPLQRFRALAPSGDAFHPIDPPPLHKPLNPAVLSRKAQKDGGHPRSAARIPSVLIGCLLLTFGLLTVLAPPGESHDTWTEGDVLSDNMDSIVAAWEDQPLEAHTLASTSFSLPSGSQHGDHTHSLGIDDYFGGQVTSIHPQHFDIEWIRIYKNPKTTPLAELQRVGTYQKDGIDTSPVITPTNFPNRRARLLPSFWKDYEPILEGTTPLASVEDTYFWVDIATSGGLIDTGDNSGLVTATENNTVVPGDIVAIAINVKLHDYKAVREFINPKPGDDPESSPPPPGLKHKQIPPLFGDNPLVQAANRGNTDAEGRRIVNWTENLLPLWFNRGVKANPSGTVWARNGNLDIAGGTIVAAVGIDVDSVGILNPNYPLERMQRDGSVFWFYADTAVTAAEWGHPNAPWLPYHRLPI